MLYGPQIPEQRQLMSCFVCVSFVHCCALQPSTSSQNGWNEVPVWKVSLRGTGFIAQVALRESRT